MDTHTTNDQIRQAAEAMVHSGDYHQVPPAFLTHSNSLTTIPSVHTEYVMPDDAVSDSVNQGCMSRARRFFCLFITFDLAFIGLMWLICILINGETIRAAFKKEIYHYSIYTSLFDIVLAAISRFTVLLLFYGLLRLDHWIIVALSTTITCSFLLAKVFVYNWVDSHQPVFNVLLILVSFVIAWGEAWFLDFRVIPQEYRARELFLRIRESERQPLVRNYIETLPNIPNRYPESIGHYYSPQASPEPSLRSGKSQRHFPPIPLTLQQEIAYKTTAKGALEASWDLINSTDWNLEKQNKENDSYYTLGKPKGQKLFRIDAIINAPPRYLLEELFYRVDTMPQWNPAVVASYKVQTIDENTDITYQISADAPGVTSRDFVSVRHWKLINRCYIIAYTAVEHVSVPTNDKKYIRGENVIGCWVIRPQAGNPDICQFQWVSNTNLKGWILQSIVDRAFKGVMFAFIQDLRKYLRKLKDAGKVPTS